MFWTILLRPAYDYFNQPPKRVTDYSKYESKSIGSASVTAVFTIKEESTMENGVVQPAETKTIPDSASVYLLTKDPKGNILPKDKRLTCTGVPTWDNCYGISGTSGSGFKIAPYEFRGLTFNFSYSFTFTMDQFTDQMSLCSFGSGAFSAGRISFPFLPSSGDCDVK